jgi:hypothetical protein
MDINENALDYLVDDLDNLNLNDDYEKIPIKIENDNVSAIYSENSVYSEEKSLISNTNTINLNNVSEEDDDIESNISIDSFSEPKTKKIEDTPMQRSRLLIKINNRINRGFTTKVKCTINTPLEVLNQELLYQNEFIKEKDSVQYYKDGINNSVTMIEYLSGWISMDKFNVDLTGLSKAWNQEENQLQLDAIVEELECKYGSIELSPELRLGIALFKTIYIVVKINNAGGNTNTESQKKPQKKPKKTSSVLKPPSAALKKKNKK